MKSKSLLSVLLLFATSVFAQRSSLIYVISSPENQVNWTNIQSINSKQSEGLQTIFDASFQQTGIYNSITERMSFGAPTESTVAAAAFHGGSQRLFFIPLRLPELRWADVSQPSTPKYFSISSPLLSSLDMNNPANHITRMVIGADGYGYAATNDGGHLFRFSTGKKPELKDLGSLQNANNNAAASVHDQASSWGGDMVAGTDGLLYLITHKKLVYSIDPVTRVATHLGVIKGLPENFTINGAAADEEGRVLITCSYGNQGYYFLDINQLSAEPAFGNEKRINASDLASSNLASRSAINNGQYITGRSPFETGIQKISMYPNPVTEHRFQLNFEETGTGIHTIQVLDLSGKVMFNKTVNVSGPGQYEGVELKQTITKGLYLVKVLNKDDKTVYSAKFVVQ